MVLVVILGAAFHASTVLGFLPWHIAYSDTVGFYERLSQPGFPYISESKIIEYPLLIGLTMHFAYVVGQTKIGYMIVTFGVLLIFAIATTGLLFAMLPPDQRKKLWMFWILAPSLFIFSTLNWDMIAIFFAIAAFYCASRERTNTAAAFLALGFSTKFFPALYLVPLLMTTKTLSAKIKAVISFVATAVVINMPFVLLNKNAWWYFFGYNAARTSNNDSIWTIVRYLGGELDVSTINSVSGFLFAASFVLAMWYWRQESFVVLAAITTILFFLFNKVFSPQYVLWLLPFFVLAGVQKKLWFYALEFSNMITFFIALQWYFIAQDFYYILLPMPFIVLRHVALFAILGSMMKRNRVS